MVFASGYRTSGPLFYLVHNLLSFLIVCLSQNSMGELSSPVVLNGTSKTNGVTNGTSKDATALDAALSQAWERYTTRNPGSLALYETTLNYMPGANTRTVIHAKPFPLTIARGHSHTVEDVDGHQYVDFLNEYSAGIYGHDPEPLKKAIARTIEDGWALGANNIHQTKLAKMLLERFSNSMDMIRFTNSGTEANLMAVGAALNFTGRKKVSRMSHKQPGRDTDVPTVTRIRPRLPWQRILFSLRLPRLPIQHEPALRLCTRTLQ